MTPWYQKARFYHIYPLGLCGCPKYNDFEYRSNLIELKQWLPHIKELNCNAIYIGPLFQSTSHGYDTMDYYQVDTRLGNNQDFKDFVKEAHQLDIKIVVDGVFNHVGRDFFAFKDLQVNKQMSNYVEWFKHINFSNNTHYNDGFAYEAWRNCYELVNLNQKNPEVIDYIMQVIHYWIEEFDIDGIRLDCADCLDFDFMNRMSQETKQHKVDFWLMGEVIHGDYSRWQMLDSLTNYELHKGLYSGHNDHNYFEIAHTLKRQIDLYSHMHLYTFVDNHDVNRVASLLNNPKHLNLVYALLYTLPGIPSLYYGSEFGITGKKTGNSDDALRPALQLNQMQATELTHWIQTLAKLHEAYNDVLVSGSYQQLHLTNRQFVYARSYQQTTIIVALNNDDQAVEIQLKEAHIVNEYKTQNTVDLVSFSLEANQVRIFIQD